MIYKASFYNDCSRAGLCTVLEFMVASPKLKPNKINDDEDKYKCSIELRLTKPQLVAGKKMSI
ncbi:hypothetical protein [Ferruginibacter sp.]|nr:hypothetical protein [Ferruginibacter sp.]